MEKNRIRAKHPGSATLANSINFNSSQAGNKKLKKLNILNMQVNIIAENGAHICKLKPR
jgi:hypothetical protein